MIFFAKMSGSGNDFVVIDNRRGRLRQRRRFARILCERTEGIGADGMLLLERSKRADYLMRYYNADGSDGGMCGNGGRCVAWFAFVRGIAPRHHRFEALGQYYEARIIKEELVVLAFPKPEEYRRSVRTGASQFRTAAFVDTGSPHAVVSLDKMDLQQVDVAGEGRKLRHARAFGKAGANVNFMMWTGQSRIAIRTYERGVEAETKACGTGSIACSLVASELWGARSPVRVVTRSGEELLVRFSGDAPSWTGISLQGGARITFEGRIDA
jgi:diaminopimelate epimerase